MSQDTGYGAGQERYDDGYGYDDGTRVGGTGQTRTRLPDAPGGDPYGSGRKPARSSRGLVTVVGVVVLLVAAIAFANQGGGGKKSDGPSDAKAPVTSATAPTGERPVAGRHNDVPMGFGHTEQGAQSAAANYAVVLGSEAMYETPRRHRILAAVADEGSAAGLQSAYDATYTSGLFEQIGLTANGTAPAGATFVSRTSPVGAKVLRYSDTAADVDVWCLELFGLTGEKSTKPVTSAWYTLTVKLKWNGSDWKVLNTSQRTGPTPVTGDNPVSSSGDIAGAVNEFGGFTYAR
ncbi:hypothetical protein [Streptomyces sp. NRRL S-87]|uniref:hypothetical protein n=1 Tax=Streptomyces sp. NRRL S-87 TaxID=1463920 RepID=UPI0004C21F20|nr:hypothetical protein [Streptomyces sp. NRRL S-87]